MHQYCKYKGLSFAGFIHEKQQIQGDFQAALRNNRKSERKISFLNGKGDGTMFEVLSNFSEVPKGSWVFSC